MPLIKCRKCKCATDGFGTGLIPGYQQAARMGRSVKCRFTRVRWPRVNRAHSPPLWQLKTSFPTTKKKHIQGETLQLGWNWQGLEGGPRRLLTVSAMTSSPSATPTIHSSRCRLRRDIFLTLVTSDRPHSGSRTCTLQQSWRPPFFFFSPFLPETSFLHLALKFWPFSFTLELLEKEI